MQNASQDALFQKYRNLLIGKTLSTVWRGYGSTLFLEFGNLTPTTRPDGSVGHPNGECTIMIQWSWRIEQSNAIVCGSWSDEDQWEKQFSSLVGLVVDDINLFGRLPELYVSLSHDFYIASFMTADEQPCWTIFQRDRVGAASRWLKVKNGSICERK